MVTNGLHITVHVFPHLQQLCKRQPLLRLAMQDVLSSNGLKQLSSRQLHIRVCPLQSAHK